ncbi:LamG-like jellyroll fold domain-containing protein, partial [Sneathiella glossodoripedis]|uniref:LamG-like jellyroll fold domain-containing protein n=1 Tax=Sneathiella glossodoripedis TaxID=418853 RepID=UPI0005621129
MRSLSSQAEQEMLEAAAANFGEGVVNLGRDPSMFGMESFTLSATFELNSLNGGDQRLLWNHTQYGIIVKDNDVRIALRGEDGKLNYYTAPDVLENAGWHDIQITYDAPSNELNIYLDGSAVFSTITSDVELSGPKYWDVTAGGTLWGRELDGNVADVSFHDEVLEIDASQSIAERMYTLDDGNLPELETPVETDQPASETPILSEQELLEAASANFGEGVVNLGRDPSMFGMESFTLSATFELNSLSGGDQALLWNHMQYGIRVKNDDVRIALRGEDGKLNYYTIPDVLKEAGWHDVQITYDASSNVLGMYLDGESVFSTITTDVEISGPKYWDVTAGGTLWGRELDGRVADVSFHDEVLQIDASQSIAERMYALDDGNLPEFETPVENTP